MAIVAVLEVEQIAPLTGWGPTSNGTRQRAPSHRVVRWVKTLIRLGARPDALRLPGEDQATRRHHDPASVFALDCLDTAHPGQTITGHNLDKTRTPLDQS